MPEFIELENKTKLPTIHVISDSMGLTAQAIASAASVQFGVQNPCIEVLSKVRTEFDIIDWFEKHQQTHRDLLGDNKLLVFYTIVDPKLASVVRRYADAHDNIFAVDILTPAIQGIEQASGLKPSHQAGVQHIADQKYFKRIEAVEFTIAHDDGRKPDELTQADIVLAGVSRTSKTPLSIYLSQMGFKVANVPLDPQTQPPEELFDVDTRRLFGLMTTPEVLVDIRKRRIAKAANGRLATQYADFEYVYNDLEKARSLMRKLGCIVIHTEHRAVEETAQEIVRYYERSFPPAG